MNKDDEVFVAEYDGQPCRVFTTEDAAKAACAEHLKADRPGGPWDWIPDQYGWVMRATDPDTDRPGHLLGGRITRTCVEK